MGKESRDNSGRLKSIYISISIPFIWFFEKKTVRGGCKGKKALRERPSETNKAQTGEPVCVSLIIALNRAVDAQPIECFGQYPGLCYSMLALLAGLNLIFKFKSEL